MSFSVEVAKPVALLRVVENITFVNQNEFTSIWDRLIEDECDTLILDLSSISYFGSMAFGLVAKNAQRWSKTGKTLAVIRPEKDEVFQVFKITRLVELLDFYDSEAEALEALGHQDLEFSTVVADEKDPVESKIAKLSDKDPEVRRYTAWALGLVGDGRAIQPLEKLLEDSDPRVREAARDSLEKIRSS